jgi:hypothetical protein
MTVCGDVINHKIFLRNSGNNSNASPQNLQFGVVYLGETAELPIRLENKSSSPLRWIISHAGELLPQVPGQSQIIDNKEVEMSNSMTVSPAEGVLAPFASEKVVFCFSPTTSIPDRGFKTKGPASKVKSFMVPMQLKILNSSNKHRPGEDPINFVLGGGACPLLVTPSSRAIEFPLTKVGESYSADLVLTNGSEILSATYQIDKMAHYYCIPNSGKIAPGEKANIEILFKPNQFGNHERNLKCVIKSERACSKRTPGCSIEGSEMFIKLTGSTINVENRKSKSAESNLDQWRSIKKLSSSEGAVSVLISGRLQSASKTENEAWNSKITNRDVYVDYIRESRDAKVQNIHKRHFNNDGVLVDKNTSIHHKYTSIDPISGLLEPSIAKEMDAFDKSTSTKEKDLNSHADQRLLEVLIQKMFEKTVQKLRPGSFTPPKKLIQTSITSTELIYIKTSLSSIDLGDITVRMYNVF